MENNIDTEINEALEAEDDVLIEDVNENTEEAEEPDLDFEYDENGDIIIPDDENTEDKQDADEGQDETEEEEAEGTEENEEAPPAEEVVEPAETGEKDRQIAELRRQLEALRRQGKDTLSKLGVEDDDVMAGLVRLAAEADDVTPEEYLRKKNEKDRADEAMRTLQTIEFEKKMKADLAAVHAAFPETRKYDSVTKFPNFKRFGELRDARLSPKEAYIASHPDAVRESVATATQKQSLNNTKKHLTPAVSKGSKDHSVTMSKRELAEYRELFPNMSDKEIASLYRQTSKK